jgi:hypothetical protein
MFNVAKIAATALILALLAGQANAADRSMRCGTYLIYSGGGKNSTGMYEVLRKCGEPTIKNSDTWIYEQGGMFRVLTFNYEGRLARIESRRK